MTQETDDELDPPGREEMLAGVDGDEELLRVIAGLWLEDGPDSLAAVRRAVEAGDAQALERTAHAFKGSAALFRSGPVTGLAQELEEMGRAGTMGAEAAELVERLAEATDRLAARLREIAGS